MLSIGSRNSADKLWKRSLECLYYDIIEWLKRIWMRRRKSLICSPKRSYKRSRSLNELGQHAWFECLLMRLSLNWLRLAGITYTIWTCDSTYSLRHHWGVSSDTEYTVWSLEVGGLETPRVGSKLQPKTLAKEDLQCKCLSYHQPQHP